MKLGQNIELYNKIVKQTNDKLCIAKILGKLYKIKYIKKDIQNIKFDL